MRPEMVDRVATMLNYFLDKLAGKGHGQLALKPSYRHAFAADQLLGTICGIYLHFELDHTFLQAVVADGRSYSLPLFQDALDAVRKGCLFNGSQLTGFSALIDALRVCFRSLLLSLYLFLFSFWL